jgi:phosphoribosyl 1,2-cyclic phosphate phosphodiesterase
MKQKITILGSGTSQGIPVIGCHCKSCNSSDRKDKRFRTSAFIEVDKVKLLIDAGPDLRMQLLANSIEDLDAVLFTHEHQDHTAGLDDLRPIVFKQKKAMPLWCSTQVQRRLIEQYSYTLTNAEYPGVPKFQYCNFNGDYFKIQGVEVLRIHAKHGQMDVSGFRIGDITYLTDLNFISNEELKKVFGSKLLILGCLRRESHHSHFNLEEAIEVGLKSNVPRILFTHLSHHFEIHGELSALLPSGFELAFDGQTIEL